MCTLRVRYSAISFFKYFTDGEFGSNPTLLGLMANKLTITNSNLRLKGHSDQYFLNMMQVL